MQLAAAALVLVLLLALTSCTDKSVEEVCSAADLSAASPSMTVASAERWNGVSAKALRMRSRIIEAAIACDYAKLERLGEQGATRFIVGEAESEASAAASFRASSYWRRAEAEGRRPMHKLVALLHLPVATGGTVCSRGCHANYYWPRASQSFTEATPQELATLRLLYGGGTVSRATKNGRYVGMDMIGLNDDGDWFYFAIEDRADESTFEPVSTDGWATYAADEGWKVSFRHPSPWKRLESEYDASSFSDGIIWTGTAKLHDPCVVSNKGEAERMQIECGRAFDEIKDGEIVVYLYFAGGPLRAGEDALDRMKGDLTEIDGRRAKVQVVEADPSARDDKRYEHLITAVDRGNHIFVMEAWYDGSDAQLERTARTVASTIRLTPVK
jgi:hypothetical protein